MDQGPLVADEIRDGRRLVERFAADGNPLLAAFWHRSADDGGWFLNLITESVDRVGPAATYRALNESFTRLQDARMDYPAVKLLSATTPASQEVLTYIATNPTRLGRFIRVGWKNWSLHDDFYIYPPHLFSLNGEGSMTSDEVSREVLKAMNQGSGFIQPSRVDLKDGTHFFGVPFAIQARTGSPMTFQFLVDREDYPRTIGLDEIAAVH